MPLTPRYTWTETDASVEVSVEVPGVSRGKADVFATDAFVKVNCPPYLLALDLAHEVDDSRSSASITPGQVVFKLFKRNPGLWGKLEAEGDRAALTARRNASVDRAYAALEEARKARLARKQQEDKHAVQRSMDVDRRKRQEVERRKAAELAAERGQLEAWKQGLAGGPQGQGDQQDAESDYEDEEGEEEEGRGGVQQQGNREGEEEEPVAPDHADYHGRGWRPSVGSKGVAGEGEQRGQQQGQRTGRSRVLVGSEDGDSGGEGEGGAKGSGDEEEEGGGGAGGVLVPAPPVTFKPLPPPRAKLQPVQVTFTKLETGHLPAREQREDEIRAFRKKQQALSSSAAADSVDLADRQPLFLKDRGDELFRAGDHRGALNAYTRAISLDDSHPGLYGNRAACRLALGEWEGAAEDCDAALELLAEQRDRLDRDLLPGDAAEALSRQLVRLLVRRAQARAALAAAAAAAAAINTTAAAAKAGPAAAAAGGRQQQLVAEALADYDAAIKYVPPGSAQAAALAADREELEAALRPADAAALRQRGDARFRCGDYEGAAEAFSALLGLPRTKVPESERLAAFSNRAACHLVLERYAAARADCDAGLALLLTSACSTCTTAAAAAAGERAAAAGSSVRREELGADVAGGEAGLVRIAAWAEGLDLGSGGGGEGEGGGVQGPCGLAPAAAVAAAARLLLRRGGAAAHLQLFGAAAADQGLAGVLWRRLGEGGKAEAAEADAGRMRALAEGREAVPSRSTVVVAPSLPGEGQPPGEGQQGKQSEEEDERQQQGVAGRQQEQGVVAVGAEGAEGRGGVGGGVEGSGGAGQEGSGVGSAVGVGSVDRGGGGGGEGGHDGLLDEVDD